MKSEKLKCNEEEVEDSLRGDVMACTEAVNCWNAKKEIYDNSKCL